MGNESFAGRDRSSAPGVRGLAGLGRGMFRGAHVGVGALMLLSSRWRRARVVGSLKLRSAWYRSPLECEVSRDARFGRRVQFVVDAKTKNVVRIGEGCLIGDDVRFELSGGSLTMGSGVDIRRGCLFHLSGRLELQGRNVLQYGTVIHCDESITVGLAASMAEFTTLVDSSHTYDGPHEWFGHNVVTGPIEIAENAWLGAKVTVARGVRIGRRAVAGANSLVVKDVPDGWLASGVPAQLVREVAGGRRGSDSASLRSSSS